MEVALAFFSYAKFVIGKSKITVNLLELFISFIFESYLNKSINIKLTN